MRFTDLDFGSGKASFGGPVKVFQEPNHDPPYFYFQVKNNQGEDGIMLPMCLPTLVMERFIKELYRACLVRVFVFCFGFVTFYFIEVRTLILIWIQDCKKNYVWYIVLVSQLKSQFKKNYVWYKVLVFRLNFYHYIINYFFFLFSFLFFPTTHVHHTSFLFSFLFFFPPPT